MQALRRKRTESIRGTTDRQTDTQKTDQTDGSNESFLLSKGLHYRNEICLYMFRTTKFSMSEQFQTLTIFTLPFFQYLDSWQKYSISFEIKVVFKLFCGEMKQRYISLITFKDSSANQLMIFLQLKNYLHIMLIFSYLVNCPDNSSNEYVVYQ